MVIWDELRLKSIKVPLSGLSLTFIFFIFIIMSYVTYIDDKFIDYLIAIIATIISSLILFVLVIFQIDENNNKLDQIEKNKRIQNIKDENEKLKIYLKNINMELEHNKETLKITYNELSYTNDSSKKDTRLSTEEVLTIIQQYSDKEKEHIKSLVDDCILNTRDIYISASEALSTNAYNDLISSGLQKYIPELSLRIYSMYDNIKAYSFQSKIYLVRLRNTSYEEIYKNPDKFNKMEGEIIKKPIPSIIEEIDVTLKFVNEFIMKNAEITPDPIKMTYYKKIEPKVITPIIKFFIK